MDSAPPPPSSGLGNFKGVMLCSRPPESSGAGGAGAGGVPPPFRSAVPAGCLDQVGLQPAKRIEPMPEVKKCGPSAALRRHVQWIKELQEQVREDQRNAEGSAQDEEERKKRMQANFKKQRDAIRKVKSEAAEQAGTIDKTVIESMLQSNKPKKSSGAASASKPLWAMTEAEKEVFDEAQAADLISFAEGLDFDTYISDLEFRECLQVVKDRAQKLKKEQDAFKDSLVKEFAAQADSDDEAAAGEGDDAFSDLASSAGGLGGAVGPATRRRRGGASGDDRPDWDASTACGEDRAADRDGQSAAAALLESNPQLRAVHSKGSVQKLIEKATAQA